MALFNTVTLTIESFKGVRHPLEVDEESTENDIKAYIARHCRISQHDITLKFGVAFQTTVKDSGLVDGAMVRADFPFKPQTPKYQSVLRFMKRGFAKTESKAAI